MKMIIVDKFTPEALYDQLDDNETGVMLWKDELKSLFAKNDERMETLRTDLISAWSGQSIIRNTKTQGSNILTDPYIRVGGNVQPDVVKTILSDNKGGFNADGFIVRFQLIAHLKKNHVDFDSDFIEEFSEHEFMKACKKLLLGKIDKVLTFDKESRKIAVEFMNNLDTGIQEATDSYEKEFLSKAGSLFASMIIILHELSCTKKDVVITSQTTVKALNIANVAINNAFHLFNIEKRERATVENAELYIEEWLDRVGIKYFKTHDNKSSVAAIRRLMNSKVNNQQIREFFEKQEGFIVIQHGRGYRVEIL